MAESKSKAPKHTFFRSIARLFTRVRLLTAGALALTAVVVFTLIGGSEPSDEQAVTSSTASPTPKPATATSTASPAPQDPTPEPPAATPQSTVVSQPVATSIPPTAAPTLAPTPVLPANVTTFGAKGNGVTDDSDAIRAALKEARDVLMFPAGTYVYSGSLRVERDGLRLIGSSGAVLLNSSTKAIEPIILIGNNTSIDGLTIRSSRRSRHVDLNYIIRVTGQSQSVINTKVEYGGILIEGANNCLIASNTVTNSPADSIRNTDARNCQVLGNTVRLAGDDMISVVSTQGEGPLNSNILIEGNNLAHQFWGRGIAVVGGENITIRNNFISDTYAAAGIIIAQENNYNTYGVRNVLIEGNQISNVQTTGQPKDGIRVGHGAIVMNANSSPVVGVLIRGNSISGTMTDGIDVRSKSCGIAILSNVMVDIGRSPIRLSDGVSSGSCVVVCRDNIFENEPVTHERCGGLEPVVTGYSP